MEEKRKQILDSIKICRDSTYPIIQDDYLAKEALSMAVRIISEKINYGGITDKELSEELSRVHPTLLMGIMRCMQEAVRSRMYRDNGGGFKKDEKGNYMGDGRIGQDVMKFAVDGYVPFI